MLNLQTSRERKRAASRGMLVDIGRFCAKTCSGLSRRSFLKLGASVPLGLGLGGSMNPARAAEEVRARSVIFIWLWGAPSHLDTFDPKPGAPAEVRGPFATIPTRTSGMRISELLPRLASTSNLYNLIRSHVTFASGHPEAGTWGLTGFAERPGPVRPSFGSVVARHRGTRGGLPSYIGIGQGIPKDVVRHVEGYGGGTFGRGYDPLMIRCTDRGEAEIPSLQLLSDLSPHRLHDRRSLVQHLDRARYEMDGVAPNRWQEMFQRGYNLLTLPEARAALDLTRESPGTREAYGFTAFGQSCLLARRLAEARVPFIQVNWSEYVEAITPNCDFGWDTHIYNFELLQDRHCPILDRALSALFEDLHQRGLMESTLVVAMGEFGRTPRINDRASRDHWERCYFSLWAGAGLRAGRVIGQSNSLGQDPVTSPITPLMVGTTIAELAGLDTQARTELAVLTGGTVINELFL